MPKIQNQAIWSKIVVFEFMSVEKLTWLQSFVHIVNHHAGKSICPNLNFWNLEKSRNHSNWCILILIEWIPFLVCVRFRCLNTFLLSKAFAIMLIRNIFAQRFNNNYATEICKSIKFPPHIFWYAVFMKSDDIINVFFTRIHNFAWIFGFLGEWLQRFYPNYISPRCCSCM